MLYSFVEFKEVVLKARFRAGQSDVQVNHSGPNDWHQKLWSLNGTLCSLQQMTRMSETVRQSAEVLLREG